MVIVPLNIATVIAFSVMIIIAVATFFKHKK